MAADESAFPHPFEWLNDGLKASPAGLLRGFGAPSSSAGPRALDSVGAGEEALVAGPIWDGDATALARNLGPGRGVGPGAKPPLLRRQEYPLVSRLVPASKRPTTPGRQALLTLVPHLGSHSPPSVR
jgi:hypothetical protein